MTGAVASRTMRRYPFHARNWAALTGALVETHGARGLTEGLVRLGLAGIAAAGWRRDTPAPLPRDTVIIVGHQRSGTTWLHRMMAAHPDASALPLHGLVLASDTWQRRFDRPRPAWLDRAQDRALASMDPIHRMRLHEPEEDEFALWPLVRSPTCTWDRPWPPGTVPDIDADAVAFAYYAQVVAKAVRRTGRRHVGKNPHFTHRMEEVRRALPGVRFVLLVRHPEEAIASRLSLIRAIWRLRVRGFTELEPHHVEQIYATSLRAYRGGLDGAEVTVRYADLVADPQGTVIALHHALGLAPPPAETLPADLARMRTGKVVHRYALEEFGLPPERIRADLAEVYTHWGFATE